jgi:hypothetical protein
MLGESNEKVPTELDEGVGTRCRVDPVGELGVELLRQVLQERVGQLLVEVSVAQREKACILLDDVTGSKKICIYLYINIYIIFIQSRRKYFVLKTH